MITRNRIISGLLVLFFALCAFPSSAQKGKQDAYVDKNGVLRWGTTNEEVRAFGINYTAMFAHAYRTAKKLNVPLEEAIDDDVYHFARLGFDAFRVHVWDTEISDTVGNLLDNDHLRLFDYALSRMKERGMNFVITPIAYWGNGWPEPDDKTPGFSKKYGKDVCLTNPEAIQAQEKYLFQFLNHVNQYTGIAYKDDPAIIAFEVSNEPHHREAPEKVTAFINRMVKSMRSTGCKKPIFYNVSHSIHLVDAYFNADIQGGTFQWYPTGLGAGHELRGNFLPNVDQYSIPFADNAKFRKAAKIVYEFDAADVGRSYIYPAMARSFRKAGMQLAAHFAYDPTFMADVNTEYGTHYMNLAYAPQKALSLMIASEVFHEIPLYQDFGKYPDNTTFGNFRVSYEEDLAEMISVTKFLYTNHTRSQPQHPDRLEKIAGFGNSTVVKYSGAGAYFLDRIEPGVWRLEVMPDALWIHDPFERTSPKKKIAAIEWKNHGMSISLDDLGNAFDVRGINQGNNNVQESTDGRFSVLPGTYLLVKNGVQPRIKPKDKWKNIVLNEFAAPVPSLKELFVSHTPGIGRPGEPFSVRAQVASPQELRSVQVFAWLQGFRPEVIDMTKIDAHNYEATIPGEKIKEGIVRYHIVVNDKDKPVTFPSGYQTHPRDWDFFGQEAYELRVIAKEKPVMLFNAATDAGDLSRQWIRNSVVTPSFDPGKAELSVNVEKLFTPDPENPNKAKIYDYSMRYFVGHKLGDSRDALSQKQKIVLTGRAMNGKTVPLQVALLTTDGVTFGGRIALQPETRQYEISIGELAPVSMVTLPRPYPTFLSYYFERGKPGVFDITRLEAIQLSIGPGIPEASPGEAHGVSIESIRLE